MQVVGLLRRVGRWRCGAGERELAQARVEMLAPCAVRECVAAERETHFGALLYEVRDERGGERDAALETRSRLVRRARAICRRFIFAHARIEDDVDAP